MRVDAIFEKESSMGVNYYTTMDYLSYLSALLGHEAGEADLFQFALPVPPELDATTRGGWSIQMQEGTNWFGIGDASGDAYTTTVWGYALPGQESGYLGPTILAQSGNPVHVNWQNTLPQGDHLLPIDFTVHIATPERFPIEDGYIPAVVHLHGGHNRSDSDGLPDQWKIQNNRETGDLWHSAVNTYDNDQQAATLWYHDHALGITRLNVYAGLAGFYLLTDEVEQDLIDPSSNVLATLPGPEFQIPMVIQDKAFTPDGELYYPAYKNDLLPGTEDMVGEGEDAVVPEAFYTANGDDAASVVPEFFGNIITVNGMAWPTLEVDSGMWRFRLLNGSDSRFYVLSFEDNDADADPQVFLVGTDGGLLPVAKELTEPFVLEPGGRLDLVVDFSGLDPDTQVILTNSGPAFEPFKGFEDDGSLAGGAVAADQVEFDDQGDPILVDNIMMFSVSLPNIDGNDADDIQLFDGKQLAGDFRYLDPADATETRKLGLFEGEDEFGRIHALLGVAENTTDINGNFVQYGPQAWDDPITEDPALGSTEIWELYNFTEDAHPIHVHLTQFQVLERHKIWFQDDLNNETGVPEPDGVPDDRDGDGDLDYTTLSNPPLDENGEFDWSQVSANAGDVFVSAELIEPAPEEQGWQDTVWVGPSEVLFQIMEFDRPGEYVWHCHILSHEDHEMMRPYEVIDENLVASSDPTPTPSVGEVDTDVATTDLTVLINNSSDNLNLGELAFLTDTSSQGSAPLDNVRPQAEGHVPPQIPPDGLPEAVHMSVTGVAQLTDHVDWLI
jgi:spore coat protein A, manganese oxidase